MGFHDTFKKRLNSTASDKVNPARLHANGRTKINNGGSTQDFTRHEDPRQHLHQATKDDNRLLPSVAKSGPRSNGLANALAVPLPNPASRQRTLGAVTDAGADMRPRMVRSPTSQSIKERQRDNLAKGPEQSAPQLDVIIPGQPSRRETGLDVPSLHDKLDRDLAAVRAHERELARIIDKKEEQIREQDIDIKRLLSVQDGCDSRIADLESELREEKQRYGKLNQAWKRSTAALSQAQRQEANHKVDDKTLQQGYQELVFHIANWADTYCASEMDHLPDSDIETFLPLTILPGNYTGDKRNRSLLLKSLIMKWLVDTIFTVEPEKSSGLWWAGSLAPEMRSLHTTLLPANAQDIPTLLKKEALRLVDVKDFSQWKAKTALLLSQRVEASVMDSIIDMLLEKCESILTPFVNHNEARAWSDLGDVIGKAINLDLEMSKSRALFIVHPWSAKDLEALDPTKIEPAAGFQALQPGMAVELVLAPALTKIGNADGDAFEIMTFVSKWIVVCDKNRESMERTCNVGSRR